MRLLRFTCRPAAAIAPLALLALSGVLSTPSFGAGADEQGPQARRRAERLEDLTALDARLAEHLDGLETEVLDAFRVAVEATPEDSLEFRQLLGAARSLGSEKLAGENAAILAGLPEKETPGSVSPSALRRKLRDFKQDLTRALLDESATARDLDSGVRVYRIATALRCLLDGNKALAHALGWRKYEDQWLDETEFEYRKKGLEWNGRFGWIRCGELSRYLQGEYVEVGSKRWTTLEEANRTHAGLSDPWTLETDAFRVGGTVDLEPLVQFAETLKRNRHRIFTVLAPSLEGRAKSAKEKALLLLGEVPHPPLNAFFVRTKAGFASLYEDPTVLGVYIPGEHRLVACQENIGTGDPDATIVHEMTHQILMEVLATDNPDSGVSAGLPMWMEEGLAEYFGEWKRKTARFKRLLRDYPTGLDELILSTLAARTVDQWDALSDATPSDDSYKMAHAIVTFFLESDAGRYEADFLGFFGESQRKSMRLLDFAGLDDASFCAALKAWMQSL